MSEPVGPLPPDTDSPGAREWIRRLRLDWSPLRESPDFRRLWLAQTFSFVGSEAGYVALSFQLYDLTNSTLAVGLLAVAELVPMLTMTLVGGALADAFDRRRLMLVQQLGMIAGVAIALTNALVADPQVWPIYLAAFVTVSAFAFGAGAQSSLTPRLVGEDKLIAANNLNDLISSLGAVSGPALAGVFIGTVGVTGAFVLALGLLALAGAADLVSAVLRGTMLLELTPDALRGRLTGIEFAQVAGAPALGNLEAGALASATSIRTSIVSGGIACLVGCVLLALAFPALLRYDARNRDPAPA